MSESGGHCIVSVFRSITRSERLTVPLVQLKRGFLSRQTRVYVRTNEAFRLGRVTRYFRRDDGLIDYEVRFPNGSIADLSEVELHVRPWNAPDDPAEVLAAGGAESQFLHDRRHAAVEVLTKLRGASQGLSALSSASVEFVPHQIAAVRRILTDPIQRYLLADEVGLGKTIEAGLVVRQRLIDEPSTKVTIVVPSRLLEQWRSELSNKMRLDQFEGAIELLAHEDLSSVQPSPEVLVVDEAHHLVGVKEGPLAASAARLEALSPECEVLLLLSATPALGDPARFLALLNLLDPVSHPIDDLAGFETKLAKRREFGRLLLGLDPASPAMVIRQRASEAQRLFPDDSVVADLAPRLIEATRTHERLSAELCEQLRGHIAESYRIHQRLIRSRRADAKGWEFMPRGPQSEDSSDLSHVRVEADPDDRISELQASIEEWRLTALDAVDPSDRVRIAELAMRYRNMIEALGVDLVWFRNTIAALDPMFEGEREILDAALSIAERDDDETARMSISVESTRRLIKTLSSTTSHPKIVAFSSSTKAAVRFHRLLAERSDEVDCLLSARSASAVDQVSRFQASRRAAVLVLDRGGEEGLNLNFADAIVHLDLPFSAARMEQRIGRLDRFGRRHSLIRHRILVPSDDDGSPWSEWQDVLADGLRIFHRSISDVQFLLEEIERDVLVSLFSNGPAGSSDLARTVRARIEDERRSQDEQFALDRLALAEQPIEEFIEALEEAEEREKVLEDGMQAWLLGVLQMSRRPHARPNPDPFDLAADTQTLVPQTPWLAAFGLDRPKAMTWRRRIASSRPDITLLRPGTPIMDAVDRYTRWDDRGTAFATWRIDPDWDEDPWLGFKVTLAVEPAIEMADLSNPTASERALFRRAQRYLTPFTATLFLDSGASLVTDRRAIEIMSPRYDSEAGDINLGSRPALLATVIDAASFEHCCRAVRDAAYSTVSGDPDFIRKIDAAGEAATAELRRRRAAYHRRSADGDISAIADLDAAELVVTSVKAPAMRVDAIGCFVVSRDRPREARNGRT
ncbi:protein DpdE [Bradyrhizobium sp. CB1015]|uniref:protein DpdE n=1 Tax=Bradyrhizobium sp. CB1015 TaxID=2976822 RepID=UPI0021AA35A9|nr:protein DpdE [Bradyrhizobium sp. CB1015]UWU92943.1 protein DpdE [Bradyrhizobium sp. CB1015]